MYFVSVVTTPPNGPTRPRSHSNQSGHQTIPRTTSISPHFREEGNLSREGGRKQGTAMQAIRKAEQGTSLVGNRSIYEVILMVSGGGNELKHCSTAVRQYLFVGRTCPSSRARSDQWLNLGARSRPLTSLARPLMAQPEA
jgi:hypothetical protein